jgi:hydroxyacylglutathione hydrolase
LPVLSRLTEITPLVQVATSELYRTATGVVGGPDGQVLLIDPGVLPGELDALAAELDADSRRVAAAVATHAHWDHVLWARALGPAPRYATAATVRLLAAHREQLVEEPLRAWGGEYYAAFDVAAAGRLTAAPAGGAIPWPGPGVRLLPAGGHCPGHAGVVVEPAAGVVVEPAAGVVVQSDAGVVVQSDAGVVESNRVLFAGDMLSDLELPWPDWELEPDPLAAYRRGLDALAAVPGVAVVVPGHGSPGEAAELRRRIDADRSYLDALEAAVAPVAEAGRPDEDAAVAAARARVDDPRLRGWPPMAGLHDRNARGLFASLRRAGPA